MERNQFTFYISFSKAAERIKKKSDRCDFYDIVKDYALYGKEPDLGKVADAVAVAFLLIQPNLDSSKRKAESGKSGGASKQTASKPQANGKQTASKPQANGKQWEAVSEKEGEREREKEKEGEREREKENECYISPPTPSLRKKPTLAEVEEYAKMRGGLIDPKPFYEFYSVSGWMDTEGKPVYNWQQKFQLWEKRELEKPKKPERGEKTKDNSWMKDYFGGNKT